MAEGFDENEVADRMEYEQANGGAGNGRPNPLALLISVGARVEAAGGDLAAGAALQERRRLMRNVDVFLNKTDGVERYKPGRPNEGMRDAHSGARLKTAYEVARETFVTPAGGSAYRRELASIKNG